MATYGTWSGFILRYPQAATKIGSVDLPGLLADGSEWLESSLAPGFSVPFSSNNLTAEVLTYKRVLLDYRLSTTRPDDSKELQDDLDKRIQELLDGTKAMITTSSDVIFASVLTQDIPAMTPYASGAKYPNTFSMDDVTMQQVDPNLIAYERQRRGIPTTVGS